MQFDSDDEWGKTTTFDMNLTARKAACTGSPLVCTLTCEVAPEEYIAV